ncbi:cyclin-T1-like isoform X2 [Panonychus citri]|uniref:cyclin-T1-like isoform X2 n=1 Tax=Panonychus citri TaxID=50023 RepID=UPI0023073891|nr:cyclin-T1-like isoform X2 [Panonychus citri]
MSNNQSRWYFSKESLINTPSRKCGIDYDKEMSYRQQAANLIQDMGRLLKVDQLCINTAIVYMHRFYIFHSFQRFHRNAIAACALFLAAKVEEQPRKLEYVIKVAHTLLNPNQPPLDPKSDYYLEQAQELVVNENIMLQTLGFDIGIEHPHTFIIKCCQLVKDVFAAHKDLAQTSYFMATNSLHLTTMCLQYRPTLVACVCIHLACKWSNWELPQSSEGKDWFYYVDNSVTSEILEELTSEFLAILDKCPSRLKSKILASAKKQGNSTNDANAHSTPKDRKGSSVKNETKSKQLPSSSSSSSGYNQPSTSKADEPSTSTSTSTPTIPVPSMTKKQSPPSPTKKFKDETVRTHSTTHLSQVSGQLTNVHNSSNLNAHNTTTDSRQRSQSIKDEKKLSLLKSDTKSKPPLPHPPSLSSSSSHSGQLSTSRQSSEMSSSIPSISSSEFDKRSPSPVTRKNKKEILPPFPNKPQPNSHSSSGQNVANNSINYNPHFQGNSSFTNETRPRPAFKEDKISPIKNEVNRPKPVASVSNNHSSQAKFLGDVSMNLNVNQSNANVKKEKRSPSPADTRKRVDYPTNLQKSSNAAGHSSQSGHTTFSAYKDKREKEKILPQPQTELINNKSKDRPSLDRNTKLEKVERLDRPERERIGHHERVNKVDHHDYRERRERIEGPDHHDNRHDKPERVDKTIKQDRNDPFDRIYSQLPPLQHLQPPPHQPIINTPITDNFKDFAANSNEIPRMPRLIPQANQERFDRPMKQDRSQEPQQQMLHHHQQQQLDIHQHQMLQHQQLHQQQLQQIPHLQTQPQPQPPHYFHPYQTQQQQQQQQQQLQFQQLIPHPPQLPQIQSQLHHQQQQQQVNPFDQQSEMSINEDKDIGIIKGEFEGPGEKLLDSVNEFDQDQTGEEVEDDLDDKLKSKDKHHHRHHRHHQSSSSKHHHHSHGHKKHHKEKHKSKHKHKDKERDRDRDRHRNDHEEVNHRDKDFKLTLTVPKEDKSEEEIERPSPIKLKISKQKINYSGSESDLNSETPSSLRIVIPKDRLGGNGGGGNSSNNTMTRNDNLNMPSSSTRKRKTSPNESTSSSSFLDREIKLKKEKFID